jgi:hypothetical protein
VKLPKILKADVERAFIHACYRYVCQCYSVSIDWKEFGRPFVAVGATEERMWFMDFSSSYEFPAEMKQAAVNRRMLERTKEVLGHATFGGKNGGEVTLVTPDQVQERVRQTVLAVRDDEEAHAFVQAALMFRKAFTL